MCCGAKLQLDNNHRFLISLSETEMMGKAIQFKEFVTELASKPLTKQFLCKGYFKSE